LHPQNIFQIQTTYTKSSTTDAKMHKTHTSLCGQRDDTLPPAVVRTAGKKQTNKPTNERTNRRILPWSHVAAA